MSRGHARPQPLAASRQLPAQGAEGGGGGGRAPACNTGPRTPRPRGAKAKFWAPRTAPSPPPTSAPPSP
jgi:hypothetical protein